MSNSKNTKRALLASVLSVVLCLSMLVGSTFAWFTDTASTGVNKIVAGNLDIELSYKNASTGAAFTPVSADADDLFVQADGTDILWEPGVAAVCYFKIENKGSLALKYDLKAAFLDTVTYNNNGTVVKLSDALKSAVVEMADENGFADRAAAVKAAKENSVGSALGYTVQSAKMLSKDVRYMAMVIWMPEETNNTYNLPTGAQPLEIQLGVEVNATQVVEESDSFDNEYDKNAPTLIAVAGSTSAYATIGEAYAATGATTFNVSGPIDVTKFGSLFSTANQNVTFNQMAGYPEAYYDFSNASVNANGASITVNGGYIQGKNSNTGNGFGFTHTAGNITYKGVTINDSWTNENTATVTYDGCKFTGTYYVWTYSVPSITFTGCTFDKTDSRAILVFSHANAPITANITNCTFKAGARGYTGVPAWTAAVEIDASNISSGAIVNITNCTADSNYNGIVRDKGGANATVKVDGAAVVANQTAFAQAIADKNANIILGAGNYTMVGTNYNVTISGTKDAVLSLPANVRGGGNTIKFDGITIAGYSNNADKNDWTKLQLADAAKVIFDNCTIKDLFTAYCSSDFTSCVFENTFDDQYSVFCYSSGAYNFIGCTFNTKCSKAIKLYGETGHQATLNVENCQFVASNSKKAAIEIDAAHATSYTVTTKNCTINDKYSALYNVENGAGKVTVDGIAQ